MENFIKPDLKPDADPAHVGGASGGAYRGILPDTRATAKQQPIPGENFTDKAGEHEIMISMPPPSGSGG